MSLPLILNRATAERRNTWCETDQIRILCYFDGMNVIGSEFTRWRVSVAVSRSPGKAWPR